MVRKYTQNVVWERYRLMGNIVSWALDVSNWQGVVDHAAIAGDGYHLVIAKATEGTTFRDSYFPRNWASIPAAGLQRGAYAFARPSRGPAIPDADFFVDYVLAQGPLAAGDILVLDMEDDDVPPDRDVSGWCLGWLTRVYERTGARAWLYSGRWYMEPHGLWTNQILGTYPLWFASYVSGLPDEMYSPPPPAWERITLWQYTSSASVPGVAGDCDSNASDLTPAELRALGYQPTPTGPTPPREPLDALWAAEQACEPVYTAPADVENLTGIRAHISAIKGRYGYP